MILIKTYKYKLKLSKDQKDTFNNWIGACRYVYNLANEVKIESYKKGVVVSKFDLMKQLPDIKHVDWIKSVPSQSLQNVVERLDSAYQSYFSKIKSGELANKKAQYVAKRLSKGLDINNHKLANFGKPKWAKKDEYNSIVFKSVRVDEQGFILPKIGKVKVFKDRMPDKKLKTAIVTKENNEYFICVTFEYQSKNIYPTNENQVVGIDMGVAYFSVDSNGYFIDNPRTTKKYERKLRIKNRSLARKTKDSKRFKKTKRELTNLHKKISDCRKDFLHKESLAYVKQYSLIACEDLKVSNMIKFGNLSKHIADVSWSKFFSMLQYKCSSFEKEFIQVNPKYTSMKCNSCGYTSPDNRKTQSKFACVSCGCQQNADVNAAKNILGEGIALKRKREAVACALLLEPHLL